MNRSGRTLPDVRKKPFLSPALLLAVGTLLAWFIVLTLVHPTYVIDERYHFAVIEQMARDRITLTPELPMLPGYHVITALGCRVFGVRLSVARGISTLF